MFLKYRATCFTMSVEPSPYASVTQRSVLMSGLYTMYNLNFPPLFSEQNGSVCPQVSLSSNFFFSVSLLCVTWFWVLCLFQSRYVHFTRVRKLHDSLTLNKKKNSITSQTFVTAVLCASWRSSCPLLFSSFELGFSDTTCDSCCENLLHVQNDQNRGSSVRASRPFYFLQLQALTFKHCSSFSCPNTFPFDLPSSLFIAEDTVRFQNIFCQKLWKNAQKF